MRKSEVSNSLRPFTIAQINRASQAHTDAEWRVDDVEIGQVSIIGQVASVQKQTTNSVYVLDDGTGSLEARQWVDSEAEESTSGGIEELRYVKVNGTLKSFGKKRYINATQIRHITDPHEIYFHILESIYATLLVERGSPSNPAAPSAYSAQKNAPSAAVKDQFSHLPALQRSIIKFIMDQPPRDEGVHVALIAKAIAATSGEDAHNISDALDKLMDEGHVFTTIDDSHFNVPT